MSKEPNGGFYHYPGMGWLPYGKEIPPVQLLPSDVVNGLEATSASHEQVIPASEMARRAQHVPPKSK